MRWSEALYFNSILLLDEAYQKKKVSGYSFEVHLFTFHPALIMEFCPQVSLNPA